jgi:hypothetical protein
MKNTQTVPVHYWSRNDLIIDDPTVNIRFEELLFMTDLEVTEWVDYMRGRVRQVWDETGIPPLAGRDESEMEEIFREMSGTPGVTISMHKAKSGGTVPYVDEIDGKENVIINNGNLGSCVNQFFPTMMKAAINYQTKVDDSGSFNGYAVYDLFWNERFRNRMQKGCRRHFRRDSFYRYSASIPVNSTLGIVPAETGKRWVQLFKRDFIKFKDYGYWLSRVEPAEDGETTGSGYTQVDASKFLWLSKADILELIPLGIVTAKHLSNLIQDTETEKNSLTVATEDILDEAYKEVLMVLAQHHLKDDEQYHIRFYKKATRIFPLGFTAFKIGYIQVAVNFPPMIAKYIYEKYTNHCKKQKVLNIYDPSSGWGGRIAGAMCVMDDRKIHYIGTDPNTDNYIPELGITRYEYLANFVNKSLRNFEFEPHTYDVYQLGSEVIGSDENFKKYKGKLDLVFTSPPYFNRESYSEDETQSLKKFPFYEGWRDGFLKPTLKTAYSYLRKDRYLLWNIADILVGDQYYPLEQDSIDILKSLGAEFVGVEKMVLANMPGANRVGDDGKPTCKNYCRVNGKWHKTELIFVFKKP